MTDRDHFVYTCFDVTGAVLYVGCTQDLRQRQAAHHSFSHWFRQTERVKVSGPYPRDVALRLEAEAIRMLRPKHNTVHAGRNGKYRRGTVVNGFRIRILRERAGLTQRELGEAVGCSAPQICRIEKGDNKPRAALLAAIAEALKVPIDAIRSDAEAAA